MMQRSKNVENRMQKAANDKSKLLKDVDVIEPLKMEMDAYHKQNLVLAKDLSLYYEKGKTVFAPVSFEINQGDRVSLMGTNGSGKSSLIKLLMGENIAYDGELHMGSGLRISYICQDTSFLKGTIQDYAKKNDIDITRLLTMLRKLGFEREHFDVRMESMSEGQKKKVLIASSLCTPAHVYIWDEPLNYIDILTRMQIEEVILEDQPTLLFVEHDVMFQDKIATKQIQL